jgi:predicted PurR-regulated permease PerM
MIVITVVQQIDANILKPLLMGRSTNLHPLIIVISVMVFGKFFGVVGILVAIPITAFLKSIINYAISKGFSLKKIYKL